MGLTHALKWSFLAELASRTVQPLVFILLARLLTPEDYGVVAAAAIIISFTTAFWEAGMGKAVIQYPGDQNAAANAAFWMNILLGLFVASLLFMSSGFLARLVFQDPRVSPVLKVMSLQILMSALVCVHSALLQKDMRFRRLFWVRLLTVSAPGLVSVPLALTGLGYWALIAGTLAGQALQVAVLWSTSTWRPAFFGLDWAIAKKLLRFGVWVGFTSLLFWFYNWADSLMVGIYLGSRELGLFRTGNTFVTLVFGTLFAPLIPVLYSHFSGIQQDRARIRSNLFQAMRVVTFFSVPIAVWLHVNAPLVGRLVFGLEWGGVEYVLAVMALAQGISWITSMDGEAYRAIGVPKVETQVALFTLGFYVVGYSLSIRHGLHPFLWTRLGLVIGAMAMHLWFARKTLNFPIGRFLRYLALMAMVSVPAAVLARGVPTTGVGSEIALAFASAALLAVGMGWVERKDLIPELWNRGRSAFH